MEMVNFLNKILMKIGGFEQNGNFNIEFYQRKSAVR
jgi:hypothetical protein